MPRDFEVIGYNRKTRSVIQWDAPGDTTGEPGPYEPGETPEDFGLHNLTPEELAAITRDGWTPEKALPRFPKVCERG